MVRLQLASMLQRVPPQNRWGIAKALLSHANDAIDANLPLMYWYAIEPLVDEDFAQFCKSGADFQDFVGSRARCRRLASHDRSAEGLDAILSFLEAMTKMHCLGCVGR